MTLLAPLLLAATPEVWGLVYERTGAALSCPEQQQLEDSVSARLGRQPFSAGAPQTLEIRVSGDAAGLTALIVRLDASGTARGRRSLSAPPGPCDALFEAMTLTAALTLDPLFDSASRAVAQPAPPPLAEEPAPAPAPAPAPEAPRVQLTVSGGAALGQGPSWVPLVQLGGLVQLGRAVLGLEVALQPTVRAALAEGYVASDSAALAASGGVSVSWLLLSAVVTGGARRYQGQGFATDAGGTLPRLELGLRGRLQVPLGERLSWVVQLEGMVMLLRPVLEVGGRELFKGPLVGFAASSGLSFWL